MNGQSPISTTALCWPKKLLSADDLRRHLTSQRELLLLPRTIVTPLAADELRARGVRISWQVPKAGDNPSAKQGTWSYAQEKPEALVASAVQALERDGITLTAWDQAWRRGTWANRRNSDSLNAGHCGVVVFCGDPALVCCIANKIAGLRAVQVGSVVQLSVRAQERSALTSLRSKPRGERSSRFGKCSKRLSRGPRPVRAKSRTCSRRWTAMRIAEVIGTVTLSRCHPALTGFRWIIGVPFSLKALQTSTPADGEDLVILDELGAGLGQKIGVSEGVEAAMPFYPTKKPLDAYCACLLDTISVK